jgi:hypothetical protein
MSINRLCDRIANCWRLLIAVTEFNDSLCQFRNARGQLCSRDDRWFLSENLVLLARRMEARSHDRLTTSGAKLHDHLLRDWITVLDRLCAVGDVPPV